MGVFDDNVLTERLADRKGVKVEDWVDNEALYLAEDRLTRYF